MHLLGRLNLVVCSSGQAHECIEVLSATPRAMRGQQRPSSLIGASTGDDVARRPQYEEVAFQSVLADSGRLTQGNKPPPLRRFEQAQQVESNQVRQDAVLGAFKRAP